METIIFVASDDGSVFLFIRACVINNLAKRKCQIVVDEQYFWILEKNTKGLAKLLQQNLQIRCDCED